MLAALNKKCTPTEKKKKEILCIQGYD